MFTKTNRREWLKFSAVSAATLAVTSFDSAPDALARAQSDSGKLVRLTSNENLYGFSPKAKRVLLESTELANQYADREKIAKLEKMIADREGLKTENVILGSGSGEVLCMAGAAYGWQSGELVTPDLTFPLLFGYAENFGAKVEKVPLNERFEHDLGAMDKKVSRKTSLCYVCNPNNPTGTILPAKHVRNFCDEASRKTTIFVDEAYLEYTDEFPRNSMVDLVRQEKNVIVSRTFSKIYGLAGMRVGYGLAKAEIAEKLKKFRMSWFNSLGVNAALAAYDDTDFIKMSREKNRSVREFVSKELARMNLFHPPAHGNFLWVKFGEKQRNLSEKMRSANLLVRSAPRPHENWARITVGTAEQMKRFVETLRAI